MTALRQTLIALLLLVPVGGANAGKSYSSGGSKSSSSGGTRSSSSGTRSSSSSGGKSYSSGSSSKPSSSSSSSSRPSSSPSSSRPSGSSATKPSSAGSTSKPSGSSYDSKAANAARRSESRYDYERRGSSSGKSYSEGNTAPGKPSYTPGTPRSTYNDRSGRSHPVDPRDRRIDQLRRELNEERWYNRQQRTTIFFGSGYYGPPGWWGPRVVYSDPYSDMFFWWMLSQSLDYRSAWVYNHYDYMDRLRYRDLMERDRQLEARVRQLEQQGKPRDPTYTPNNIDPDLMYTDEYVGAAVNPTITESDARDGHSSSGGHFFRSCFTWMLAIGIVVFLIWFIFIKRWGGSSPVQGRKV